MLNADIAFKNSSLVNRYLFVFSQKYKLFLSVFLSSAILLIFSFRGLLNGMVVYNWISMLTVPLVIIALMEILKLVFYSSNYYKPVSLTASYIEFMTALAGFSALGVMASYGAVWGDGIRLAYYNDKILNYIDSTFLFFNWLKFDLWLKQSTLVVNTLQFFYNSISILPFVLAGLLLADNKGSHLLLFFVFICISAVITNAIFYALPAFGPVALIHLNTTADTLYLPSFKAALEGTGRFVFGVRSLDGVFIPTDKSGNFYMTGIVPFPSYHVVLAIGIAYFAKYLKPLLKYLFWFFSIGMITAAIPIGGHYLIDVIGGCVVATVAIFVCEFLQNSTAKISYIGN